MTPASSAVLPRLINARELSEQLGNSISVARLYELCRENKIPHTKFGRSTFFDPSAVADWIRAGGAA